MAKSRHDAAVDRIANKRGSKHKRKGVDIRHKDFAIEVAIGDSDLYQSMGQLRRSRKKKKYIAVPSRKVKKARKLTKRTGIGVMNLVGDIKKRTRRKRR